MERLIPLRSMSPRLRLVTGVAVAQLVVAAVFLCLRGVHLPLTVAADVASRQVGVIAVPTVVLWVAVGFVSLAWSYMLAGAIDAAWQIRLVVLLAFSGSTWLLWLNAGFHGPFGLGEAALLGVAWLLAALAPLRNSLDGARRPRTALLGIQFAVVAGIYALFWFGPSSNGPSSGAFASAVFEQLVALAVVLIPALLLAGSEFGEWGAVVGEGIGVGTDRLAGRSDRRLVEALLAVLVAAGVLTHVVLTTGSRLLTEFAIGVVVGGALLLAVRAVRVGASTRWSHALPYGALLLAAVGIFVVTTGDLVVRTSSAILPSARELALGGDLIGYGQRVSPQFGIEYPSAWTVQRVPPDYTIFDGADFGGQFMVVRIRVPADQFPQQLGITPKQVIGTFVEGYTAQLSSPSPKVAVSSFGTDGPWTTQRFQVFKPGVARPWEEGAGWERVVGDRVWLLLGTARTGQSYEGARAQLFAQMANSWTEDAAAYRGSGPVSVTGGADGYPWWAIGAWALVALAALGMLVRRGSSMSAPRVATLLLFLTVALLLLASAGTQEGGELGRGFLHLAGIQATVAVGSLCWLGWALVAKRRTALRTAGLVLMGNVGLQVVVWLYQLYGSALSAGGQFSVAQGLIVLAALLWELAFSGLTMTNKDSPRFPRHARVLVFCGYVMLVATTVMFFSSLHVQSSGSRLEPVFESELWVQRGMVVLAVPLLITVCILRWLDLSGHQAQVPTD